MLIVAADAGGRGFFFLPVYALAFYYKCALITLEILGGAVQFNASE